MCVCVEKGTKKIGTDHDDDDDEEEEVHGGNKWTLSNGSTR